MRYLDVGGGLGIDYDGSKTSYTGIASLYTLPTINCGHKQCSIVDLFLKF